MDQKAASVLNRLYPALREQELIVDGFLAKPGPTQPFLQRLYEVLNLPPDEYSHFVKQRQARFAASLSGSQLGQLRADTIPPITHRIWLTSIAHPHQPPPDYLAYYIQSIARLPHAAQHLFWTNSPDVAIAVGEQAATAGLRDLEVMSTAFFDEPIMQRVALLIEARKFVLATDIMKFIVLERYGGIYSDLGVLYDDHVFDLVQLADYAFIVSPSRFFQTSFVACAAHAIVTRIFLGIMHSPGSFDPTYASPDHEPTSIGEVNMFAGVGMTACAMLFMPQESYAFMVPAQSRYLQCQSQQSWYGEKPKFGNALIQNSAPTLITRQQFAEADELFRKHVRIFGHWPLLAAQLRVFVPLHDSLDVRKGIPSGIGASSCHYAYRLILGRLLGSVRTILHIDTSSSDANGPEPTGDRDPRSAAWKNSFPRATVVILNQASAAWLGEPGDSVEQQLFDLIIDDGERGFSLNRTLADAFSRYATSGEALVIENVSDHDLRAWEDYLAQGGLAGATVAISGITAQRCENFVLLGSADQAPPAAS